MTPGVRRLVCLGLLAATVAGLGVPAVIRVEMADADDVFCTALLGFLGLPGVEGIFHADAIGSSEEIPVRKADDILAELGISPEDIALIWMDVEGHEPKALAGMQKILSTTPPLYFEFTPARYSENEVLWIEKEILDQYNSTRVHSNEWRDLPEEGIRKLDADSHMNLFCTMAGS